jgi:hypothetical protein
MSSLVLQGNEEQPNVEEDGGEKYAIKPVQDAAVPREEVAGIFKARELGACEVYMYTNREAYIHTFNMRYTYIQYMRKKEELAHLNTVKK